jgi:DeoR family transcriptional regulator of aga operon
LATAVSTSLITTADWSFQNLTVITNAANIAAELSGSVLEVILTGGSLRKNSFSLVGPLAEETLHKLHADILFLGVDGLDIQYGLSTPNVLEAKVNRAMTEISKVVVATRDSSKFGKRSLSLIASTSSLQHIIADTGIPKADLSALKKSGVQVTVV